MKAWSGRFFAGLFCFAFALGFGWGGATKSLECRRVKSGPPICTMDTSYFGWTVSQETLAPLRNAFIETQSGDDSDSYRVTLKTEEGFVEEFYIVYTNIGLDDMYDEVERINAWLEKPRSKVFRSEDTSWTFLIIGSIGALLALFFWMSGFRFFVIWAWGRLKDTWRKLKKSLQGPPPRDLRPQSLVLHDLSQPGEGGRATLHAVPLSPRAGFLSRLWRALYTTVKLRGVNSGFLTWTSTTLTLHHPEGDRSLDLARPFLVRSSVWLVSDSLADVSFELYPRPALATHKPLTFTVRIKQVQIHTTVEITRSESATLDARDFARLWPLLTYTGSLHGDRWDEWVSSSSSS